MHAYNKRDVDITERLEAMAEVVYERDRLHGMSTAGILNDAKSEIERLRAELKKEMFRSHVSSTRTSPRR